MRAILQTLATAALAVLCGCAISGGAPPLVDARPITTDDILQANPLVTGVELPDLSGVDVLELSPEMIKFLNRWVDRRESDYFKLRHLLYAIMGDGSFTLVYDDKTRTAEQTFNDRRGNCLSFTNMFIAMARYLGLKASYQEVDIPPAWAAQGDTFILSQHINVMVEIPRDRDQMVDFNMADFRTSYDRRVITDERALAHYFNNIGVEHMLQGNVPLAFANFRASIHKDRTFSAAWVNLGALDNRGGFKNFAEAAFLQALKTDGYNMVAMSNLASLYETEGRLELAQQYRERVRKHRRENPYYRYQLAREAFDAGDYETAIGHLEYAIGKNENEDTFYFLLSLCYLNMGDKDTAQRWMKKAEEVASIGPDKQRYRNKLDLLMRANGAD